MYITNYTVQYLSYTRDQSMAVRHNMEWQRQKTWEGRNDNFNNSFSYCVYVQVHACVQTDRQIVRNIKSIDTYKKPQAETWWGTYSAGSDGPPHSQALGLFTRAQKSMNLWYTHFSEWCCWRFESSGKLCHVN